jgi:hypothetical protein
MTKDEILLWRVSDILNSDTPLCKICQRKAKYIDETCGTHYKGIKLKKNEIKKKKVKEYTKQEICKKVLLLLNDLKQEEILSKVTDVIIELQPRFNPSMCFVSNVMFTKFCDIYIDTDVSVKFEKAKNKLKNYKEDKGEFCKNTYKNRKLKSIEYVKSQLYKYNNEEMNEFFKNLKKQDDASDTFLLCFNSL